ncbi:phosphotransferase enzyme family protein [Kribbella swartbergensis]
MDELLRAWGIRGDGIRPVGEGTNNTSYFVGDEFVLRIHRNTTASDYEHAVLRSLHGLSFGVPVPLVAEDGSTVVRAEVGGELVTASLSRRIRGEHPRRGDLEAAAACGEALAELDAALARLEGRALPPRNPWDGDLTTVHPRVTALDGLLETLTDHREEVARIFSAVQPPRDLPRSIIHADIGPTNVLMDGDRVTGILDFEAAGPGYRAMDLAIGLWSFGRTDTQAAAVFRRGYLARLDLTDAELNAVPDLQLLREATSLVHWYGRHLEGLTTPADITARATRLLNLAHELG